MLNRDAESNRQVYEALLQRTKETGITGELKASNIRVVDTAEVPRWPILPRRQTDLTTAALSGLVLAVGLVFLFEYFDNRIKSPQEMRAHLGLSFLGMVPAIDATRPVARERRACRRTSPKRSATSARTCCSRRLMRASARSS